MTGYVLTLSNGDALTTVNVKTIDDQAHTSLFLIGQGIPDYGQPIAQDLVWMLENFANSTPPVNPLIGQEWYDNQARRLNVYDGTNWQFLLTSNSGVGLFDMLNTSQNVDFTAVASTAIFTGVDGKKYIPMFVLLVPRDPYTATVGASFRVTLTSSGDILPVTAVAIADDTKAQVYTVSSGVRIINGANTVYVDVTAGATGGQLNFDVYVFGLTL